MIIGICGSAGSGKDTAGDMLVRMHGFARLAFADPMKRFCAEVFDFTNEQLWGPSETRNAPDLRYPRPGKEPGNLSPRYALQTLGTEWGRDCYEPIWVELGLRTAKRLLAQPGLRYEPRRGIVADHPDRVLGVAITDVRFRNEVDAVHAAGGFIVRITRPGDGLKGSAAAHQSERELRELPESVFDATIANTGTLDQLAFRVGRVVSLLRKRSQP